MAGGGSKAPSAHPHHNQAPPGLNLVSQNLEYIPKVIMLTILMDSIRMELGMCGPWGVLGRWLAWAHDRPQTGWPGDRSSGPVCPQVSHAWPRIRGASTKISALHCTDAIRRPTPTFFATHGP